MDQKAEFDLVRRALALRARRRIGVFYAHEHSYFIATDEHDPFGTRVRVSLDKLRAIVAEAELLEAQEGRRGVMRENSVEIKKDQLA